MTDLQQERTELRRSTPMGDVVDEPFFPLPESVLREAGATAALGACGVGFKGLIAAAVESEKATLHLRAVTRPEDWDVVVAEVERRSGVEWERRPVDVMRSVYEDIIWGRWRPASEESP
jgi:hypothetical protein